jgi:hypothetical protein
MRKIIYTAVAAAAVLAGSAAMAAPAMASNGPSQAVTHLNNHPDTTGVPVTAIDPTTGVAGGDVWAYDNATEKFTVVSKGGDQYLVTMDYVGSFHGFADPRSSLEGSPNPGGSLISDGSVKGTISYDVTAAHGPDMSALPGQSPSGTHISDNISLLFGGSITAPITQGGQYTFTYHQVAGADYTQVG